MAFTSIAAHERVAYSPASPFFVDIAAGVTATIAALKARFATYPPGQVSQSLLAEISQTAAPVLKSHLTAAFKKHLNVDLSTVSITWKKPNDLIPGAYAYFYIKNAKRFLEGAPADTLWDTLGEIETIGGHGSTDVARRIAQALADSAHDTTFDAGGRVSAGARTVIGTALSCTSGLFASAVLPRSAYDAISAKTGRTLSAPGLGMTVPEISAIVLHEAGHTLHTITDIMTPVKQSDNMADAVRQLNAALQADPGKFNALVSEVCDASDLNPRASAVVKATAETISKTSLLSVMGAVVCALIGMMVSRARRDHASMPAYRASRAMLDGLYTKMSDSTFTGRQFQRSEIAADAFATRHGAGAYLASALTKMHGMTQSSQSARLSAQAARMSAAVRLASQGGQFLSVYPSDIDRMRLIYQEHMNGFKYIDADDPSSKAVLDTWVELGKRLDVLKQQAENNPTFKTEAMLLKMLGAENTDAGTFVDGLMAGNTHIDLRKLQDAVDGLVKNPFYYLAQSSLRS